MHFDLDNELQPVSTDIRHLDQAAIYFKYCQDFKIGDIHSPFRKDNTPSFGFFIRNEIIYWKDSKTGDRGTVLDFIIKWYSVFEKRKITKQEAFALAQTDVVRNDLRSHAVVERAKNFLERAKDIRKKVQAVTTKEGTIPEVFLTYWHRLGIIENVLHAYHTNFAVEVWLRKRLKDQEISVIKWGESNLLNPIYFYYFPVSDNIKIYRPLEKNKKKKWISTTTNITDIQGYHQCDIKNRKPRLLILVKSMKEVMFFRTFGIDAMAIHGENHDFHPDFIAHLRRHCKFIIGLYDNDIAGMRGAVRLRNTYDIPIFFIKKIHGAKDPTDLYLKNYHLAFELFNQLITHLHANYHEYTGIGSSIG